MESPATQNVAEGQDTDIRNIRTGPLTDFALAVVEVRRRSPGRRGAGRCGPVAPGRHAYQQNGCATKRDP